jgi:hypothetical protein
MQILIIFDTPLPAIVTLFCTNLIRGQVLISGTLRRVDTSSLRMYSQFLTLFGTNQNNYSEIATQYRTRKQDVTKGF